MILAIETISNVGRHVVSELLGTNAAIHALIRPDAAGLPDGIVSDEFVDTFFGIFHTSVISRGLCTSVLLSTRPAVESRTWVRRI
jgi:hypothetical protein